MNLYGFAGGDRVNFSDPFGLCPWTECLTQGLANWGAQRGGAAGAIAMNAGAAAAAALEVTGINAAAAAGDAIGRGRLSEGALGLAFAAVPIPGKSGARAAVSALMRDVADYPGNWKTVGALVERAVGKEARGGISIQTILQNQSGDRIVRHTLVNKAGEVTSQHLRPFAKP